MSGTEVVLEYAFNVDTILTPKQIFKVAGGCYPDVGSSSNPMNIKLIETTNLRSNSRVRLCKV